MFLKVKRHKFCIINKHYVITKYQTYLFLLLFGLWNKKITINERKKKTAEGKVVFYSSTNRRQICSTYIHLQMAVWSSSSQSPCPLNWRSYLLFSCNSTTLNYQTYIVGMSPVRRLIPLTDLCFCSCLSLMASSRRGLGMKVMSAPSFTSRPIHQSLLYFCWVQHDTTEPCHTYLVLM